MSDHMEQQTDRIMDNNENVDFRCVSGCGYYGPWMMCNKEIEKLEARIGELEEAIKKHRHIIRSFMTYRPEDVELWTVIPLPKE